MKTDALGEMRRTRYCGTLRAENIGEEITAAGWVQRQRDLGGLIFIDLRDRTGILQLVFDESANKALFDRAFHVRAEYVLIARGVVRHRGESVINRALPTGEVEVLVSEMKILSIAETPPFAIVSDSDVREDLRLRHRTLDLRRPDLQQTIMLRHKVAKTAREYFDANGFLEIETPMLTRSTPEGARDYLVPSRVHPGSFYALPQSPQLYKQLLMVAGFDRYMQIVRCFRDEDLRADRQPEFTQIDAEMSFVGIDDVIEMNEGFIKTLFRKVLGVELNTPFPRMTYAEAMERYGSDKPDTRFGFELRNISGTVADCGFKVFSDAVAGGGSVRAINAKGCAGKFSRKDIDALGEFVKTYRAGGLAWLRLQNGEQSSSFAKFLSEDGLAALKSATGAEDGDLLLIVADSRDGIVFDALGALRCELAARLGILKPDDYNFLWVTEFPLLEYDEDAGRFSAKHHPFTSPMDEDIPLLDTAPEKARAKAYDIVLNGTEVGGGSLRIYDAELQRKMFALLGISDETAKERFGFLLDAFKYGVPPHGGIAYGLDRLCMLMAGRDSIRDVIAFPKVQTAAELMTACPSPVDGSQLDELGLALRLK